MAAIQGVIPHVQAMTDRCLISEWSCEYDPAWDRFVSLVAGGRQPQSSPWAQVKLTQGWRGFRVLAERDGRTVGGAQVLVRSVRHAGRVGIVAHGPVLADDDEAVATALIRALIRAGQRHRLMAMVIQPPPGHDYLEALLCQQQFHLSPAAIAPCASTVLDLSLSEEQLLAEMRRQTRQNVRRALRGGITVRNGSRADLADFHVLHRVSSERQGFSTYALAYFQCLWDTLIHEDQIAVFISRYESRAISALLVTKYGDRAYAKFSGWSGEEAARRPNEAVFWAAIQWAKKAGCRWFDFEGFDRRDALTIQKTGSMPECWHNSSSFFKYGFGGDLQVYPQAYHRIFNPVLRWAVDQVGLPLLAESSPLRKLPVLRQLTPEAVQRYVNRERTQPRLPHT